jgi:hypothetical protein
VNRNPRKKAVSAIKNRCVTAADWRRLHLSGRPSRIVSDPELRAFVDELLPRTTFEQIATACQKRFGAKRAPSKSAVHRYWQTAARPVAN